MILTWYSETLVVERYEIQVENETERREIEWGVEGTSFHYGL